VGCELALFKKKPKKKVNDVEDLKKAVNEWNKKTPAQKKADRKWNPNK
jgi:hypothetical protein